MRVGLLADRLNRGPRRTGVGAYIEGLAHGLDDVSRDDRFAIFSWGEDVSARGSSRVEWDALPWPRRATAASWTFLGRPRVRTVGGRLDLLHVLVPTVPVASGVPLVATIHDLMPIKHPQFFARRPRLLFKETVRRLRRHARCFICVSEATRRDVVDLLGVPEERTTVVHPGVPLHFSAATPDEQFAVRERLNLVGAPLVLFVGEIAERKNVHVLVEAFAELKCRLPEARLVLAGSPGSGAPRFSERIDTLGLSASVAMLGHVPQDVVEALVAAADVLVLPSADEGFGFPALEAMSVGTAVVASDAASLPEVVGEAGLLVAAGDADNLADALFRVLNDNALRTELGERARKRAERFSWRATAERTVEVYDNTLS